MSQKSVVPLLQRIAALPKRPGVSLDAALKPSLDDEAELRRLFATDKTNSRLRDPYVGLLDVFNVPSEIRTTRARIVADEGDLSAKYVMPLSEKRRRAEGAPATATDIDEFKKNWAIFTEGSLSQLTDWSNVVAAGGSVLACVSPLPDYAKESKRTIRKYFHSETCPTSDVDLFLYGLTPEEAEKKINDIYVAIRDSVPWDVTCIRTKHTVSIHSQYPYRPVQIVLRLYQSPAEILAGFDVDAPCFAFDGERVWASPRAIVALMRQCNTIDVTRRSPSYEVRLAKYAARGFEVHVPTLRRHDIDPTIYERSIARITGLARLLALEKFTSKDSRLEFLNARRELRGRPGATHRQERRRRKFKNDLKGDASFAGLEMNDYDAATLHLPYGPGWTASRIDNLIYTTDLKMNSIFNPKNENRRLHRHPAFFGTAEECLNDCCEDCPEPQTAADRALQESEDDKYIRGRVSFIQENPGRQSISGSFNPIDTGEWSGEAYISETTKFFSAISTNDVETAKNMIEKEADVNRRDYVGRAPLHVAILSDAIEVAAILIDAGARMTWRLADGRAAIHLAAELGQTATVRKILERSAYNAEQAKLAEEAAAKKAEDEMSVSSDEDPTQKSGLGLFADAVDLGAPEEEDDAPDVVDLSVADWDTAFTPLAYAILSGSLSTVEEILAAGGDPKAVLKSEKTARPALLPLGLTRFIADEAVACDIAKLLIKNGASSTTILASGGTVFHEIACENRVKLVATLLQCDPKAQKAVNFPILSGYYGSTAYSTLATVVQCRRPAMAVLLLAHGARLSITEGDISQAKQIANRPHHYASSVTTSKPLSVAIAACNDIAELLACLSSDLNDNVLPQGHLAQTILDWVRTARKKIHDDRERAEESAKVTAQPRDIPEIDASLVGWARRFAELNHEVQKATEKNRPKTSHKRDDAPDQALDEYLARVEDVLRLQGAKTWQELHPSPAVVKVAVDATASKNKVPEPVRNYCYRLLTSHGISYNGPPSYQVDLFDELFEACFTGDKARIVQLCCYTKEKDQTPLQIATVVSHDVASGRSVTTGCSPLHAAVSMQQWDTALLILEIAGKQYKAYEPNQPTFSVGGIQLDEDDSEDGSESDDAMDTEDEDKEPDVFDISNIPSTVQCDVSPKALIVNPRASFVTPDREVKQGNLLTRAIWEDDLVAFSHIADLYKSIDLDLDGTVLNTIMQADRPQILHEYIRRTGAGFVPAAAEEKEGGDNYVNGRKVYHGLSVHGTKRKDLARKHDPNASEKKVMPGSPLVWTATKDGAFKILDYLAGSDVEAAYRFYAVNYSTEAAKQLGEIEDLSALLPAWLGWDINELGESPLTTVLSDKDAPLAMLQKLFSLAPKLMASSLNKTVYHTGHNSLLLAVQRRCSVEIAKFLLAKGASYTERHQLRGWNILHLVCLYGDRALLEFFMRKLPSDTISSMLLQRSKDNYNTPLHIAVKRQNHECVEQLVTFGGLSLSARDIHGYTPLHWAVKQGYPKVIRPLLDHLTPDALHAENGFGETPLETARRQNLLFRTGILKPRKQGEPPKLHANGKPSLSRIPSISKKLAEPAQIKAILEYLLTEGQLKAGDELTKKVEAYVGKLEARIQTSSTSGSDKDSGDEDGDNDGYAGQKGYNTLSSLRAVQAAVNARPAMRGLIHLQDVLKSVNGELSKVGAAPDEEEEEEDPLREKYQSSTLWKCMFNFNSASGSLPLDP